MTGSAVRRMLRHCCPPALIHGATLEAPLSDSFIGECCEIRRSIWDPQVLCTAQTIGFGARGAVLSVLGDTRGLSRDCVVVPTGRGLEVEVSPAWLGSLVNARGEIEDRLAPVSGVCGGIAPRPMVLDASAPDVRRRRPIAELMETGVRAIDLALSCGRGQRLGIFAPAGCGKTTLMSMLLEHADADVYVVALVGERGREVAEFVQHGMPGSRRERVVLVYATSDRPAVERRNAALVATAAAEYFRDAGLEVVLVLDSITRYARAQRDLALSCGELPARRGYPASVFSDLPRLLERAGVTREGSITAFYTVLLEDESDDPIGEEVRSILDGHIVLSRKLAQRGHYPAVDVLQSLSRVFTQIASDEHRDVAHQLRASLARADDLQLMFDLGEYRPGEQPDLDELVARRDAINAVLMQFREERSTLFDALEALHDALG